MRTISVPTQAYFVLIGYTELQLSRWLSSEHVHSNKAVRQLMGLLQLRFEYDSSTIRARFERDWSTIQHPTRSYVLSSNNEHANSFALL